MQEEHVSSLLSLRISSHSEIDFADIVLEDDTKLFLDPCLIEQNKDEWSIKANKVIKSYFDKFYEMYKNNITHDEKLKFFAHSSEVNYTKLGYGNGRNGKCKTAEGMIETFADIPKLLNQNINLSDSIDVTLFIGGFAEDCLSDTLTNILFKVLSEYTIKQCEKYGKEMQVYNKEHFYWDEGEKDWRKYEGKYLLYKGNPILLVPKNFVRNKYFFNTAQYFQVIILDKLKKDAVWYDDKGRPHYPTKKLLKPLILVNGKSRRIAAIENTELAPYLLQKYHERIQNLTKDINMTDGQLDRILYGTKKIKQG